jgi:hypothetical protein
MKADNDFLHCNPISPYNGLKMTSLQRNITDVSRVNDSQYSPTDHADIVPGKPFTGLWVGDYASHGVEFLFLQRTPTMLEVIKITGDTNVPAGKYSFVVPDLSTPTRVCEESEFLVCNAYTGAGQISGIYFRGPRWIDMESTSLVSTF